MSVDVPSSTAAKSASVQALNSGAPGPPPIAPAPAECSAPADAAAPGAGAAGAAGVAAATADAPAATAPPAGPTGPLPQDLSSKDAYMLMYSRNNTKHGSCVPLPGCRDSLPEGTRRLLDSQESERVAAEAEAERKLVAMRGAVEERRAHIRSIVAVMPPSADKPDDSYFIDSEWLARWANTPPEEELPPIDNSDLVCPHGKLEPTAWSMAKRISGEAWAALHAQWRGGPVLPLQSLCKQCTREQLEQIVAACVLRSTRETHLGRGKDGEAPVACPVLDVSACMCLCVHMSLHARFWEFMSWEALWVGLDCHQQCLLASWDAWHNGHACACEATLQLCRHRLQGPTGLRDVAQYRARAVINL